MHNLVHGLHYASHAPSVYVCNYRIDTKVIGSENEMKCPWKEHIHIKKDGMGHIYRDVEWDECEKDECPFYYNDKRHKPPENCIRAIGER